MGCTLPNTTTMTPRFIDTMQYFQDQIAAGTFASYEDMASLGSSAAFAAGEIGMTTDGSWADRLLQHH